MESKSKRPGARFASVLLLALFTFQPAAFAIEIIAHRGASFDAPENTLPAVKLAWEKNADAVEVDIHLTKDGKIVAIHDYNTKRTAVLDKLVSEQTLASLKKLDAGSWKGPRWKGTTIPTLEETIAAVPEGKRLFIEIKCGVEVVPKLERVIEESGKRDQVVVIGFSLAVVTAAKKRLPDVPVYWLYGFSERERQEYGDLSLDDLIAKVKSAGLDGLDVNHTGLLSKDFIGKLTAEALCLHRQFGRAGSRSRRHRRDGNYNGPARPYTGSALRSVIAGKRQPRERKQKNILGLTSGGWG